MKLFIGANCLSDAGLQRLTAPVRVMKKGLENLQLLELSGKFMDLYSQINYYSKV